MKKHIAMLMVIVTLFLIVGGLKMNVSATDEISITPFTMVNWDESSYWNNLSEQYPNTYVLPEFWANKDKVDTEEWVSWGTYDIETLAAKLKSEMDSRPEGSRYFTITAPQSVIRAEADTVIYLDEGVELTKTWLNNFLAQYKAIGGKLDGIALDFEYIETSSWYIYANQYSSTSGAGNTAIYDQIVAHPQYATEVRPMLVERGFTFYTGTGKSELYSIYPYSGSQYADSRVIWDRVMNIRKAQYLNEAVYEPVMNYYPDALVGDYDTINTYAWLKTPGNSGYTSDVGGNLMQVGNTSSIYSYAHRPHQNFFKENGTYPPGYNKAVFEDNAFNAFLWDMQYVKDAGAAVEDSNFSAWITYYDYNLKSRISQNRSSVSGTPYHTETLYHIGLMNPQPFLGYVRYDEVAAESETSGDAAAAEYNKRIKNISDILNELTRVVGASDRKPIEYAGSWNSDFVLSGMYAGGRNVWRISPNTTNGMTLAQFKVKDRAPTFYINGQTIIFPQGRIIEETNIEPYGSCGYWVETPVGVEPVIIHDTDRHSAYPAYEETFSAALNTSYWTTTGTATVQNGALALTGETIVNNVTIPRRITAGDSYAKKQAWEVTFTLPNTLSAAELTLLNYTGNDGFKVESGKLWYSQAGEYQAFAGLTLTAGSTYTVKREVDFTTAGAFKSNYYVYNSEGQLLAQQTNISVANVTLPVTSIGFACNTASDESVLIDNYRLYPMGVTTDFGLYDAATGYKVTGENAGDTAYRLSWMNASSETVKATIVAQYYDGDTLVSTNTVREVIMSPGADGVETEIVPLGEGTSVKLSLQTTTCANVVWPNYDSGNFDWTVAVATVNGNAYTTLAEAITNANGAAVTLLTDITTTGIDVSGTNLTIDLNGKTLTGTTNIFHVSNGGSLTVANGKLVAGSMAVYAAGEGSTANSVTVTNAVVTAEGIGVFLSGNDTWTNLNQLTVTGSSITGATAVEVKFTDATVSGSTLTATGEPTVENNASGSCTTGYAFALTNNNTGITKGVLNLSGVTGLVGIKADGTVDVTNEGDAVSAPEGYCWTAANTLSAHTHGDGLGVVTQPTCTEDGYTTYTCTICGTTYTGNITAALGHTEATREEIITNATYAQTGSKKVITYCTVCDAVLGEEIVEIPISRQTIMAGPGVLSVGANTADAALVYYGSGNPWSVIGYNGSGVASAQGNLTLFSRAIYDVYYFSDTTTNGNSYAGSWLKKTLDSVAAENFSAAELAAVVLRDLATYTVWEGSGDNNVVCDGIAGAPVDDAVLWALSTNEVLAIPKSANLRMPFEAFAYVDGNGNNQTTKRYWLRSPGNYSATSTAVGYVYNDSTITSAGNRSGRYGAVPAFNLDLDSVLLASAAGAKTGTGINAVAENTGNEWKLTILDATRTFAVSGATVNNGVVTVTYTGAAVGTNEYISVLIADSTGAYTHYGRVAAVTAANGTVTVDLSDIDMTGKFLYVFNEQYNGGEADTTKLTDYASSLVFVCLHNHVGEQTDCTVAVTCPDCGETMIAAGSHTLTQVAAQVPTCTVAGWNAYEYCSVCDYTTYAELPAAGHTPGAEADCEHDQTCTVCGVVLTEKLGHDYQAVVTAPTCTEGGCTTHTCANCGDVYTDNQTAALGHTQATREEIITGATYTQAGSKKVITYCTLCDVVFGEETAVIPAGRQSIMAGAEMLSVGANTADAALVYYGGANPWSVIGYNGSGVASAQGNMTLFSRAIYDVYYFSDNSTNGNSYAGSWLKRAIDNVASENFTAAELAAVARRNLNTYTVWQGSGDNNVVCDGIAGTPVENAALWALSTDEVSAIPKNANLRMPFEAFAYVDGNGNSQTTKRYWLRSPGNYSATSAAVGYVYNDATISSSGNRSGRYGVVPAFNLDLDSVLFVSAATGGKASAGINAVAANTSNEWKLTILNATRSFAVTNTVANGDMVTVTYTGAVTGENEYISVLVADSVGTYTHYGRVAAVTAANGTATIDLSGINMTGKTLYVFNEQYNGGAADTTKLTDYASTPIAISVTQ